MLESLSKLFALKNGNAMMDTLVNHGPVVTTEDFVYVFGRCPASKVGDGSRIVFATDRDLYFLRLGKTTPRHTRKEARVPGMVRLGYIPVFYIILLTTVLNVIVF